jgi:hypothetical protein
MPWVPPYFGSWDDMVNALLHNPFLGSGRGGKPHVTHWDTPEMLQIGRHPVSSDPMPAFVNSGPMPGVVTAIIGLISLKLAASQLPNGAAKTSFLGSIDSSIAADIDEICPPYPWPGPPPWVLAIVATLVFAANTLQEGGLKTELNAVATQILQRSLEPGRSK